MTLKHLKIFVSVYQNRSFTKAGQQLHIVQPSVSLAIKELETHYGITLFDRISRKIYPTESGDKFYDYAIHIVSLFDKMESDIKIWNHSNSIKVGTSITVGNFFLPEIVKKYQELYSTTHVQAFIKNTETIVQYIMDNKVDFAIIEGNIFNEQLNQIPILEDRLCLIANPMHPLTQKASVFIDDIAGYPLLLREPGSAGRDIVDSMLHSHNIYVTPLWESASTQALVRGVINNIGISILPYLLVKNQLNSKEIVEIPIRDFDFKRHFSIIYHKNKYLTKSALSFIELCKQLQKK